MYCCCFKPQQIPVDEEANKPKPINVELKVISLSPELPYGTNVISETKTQRSTKKQSIQNDVSDETVKNIENHMDETEIVENNDDNTWEILL